jgi:hypothetical protein
MKKPTNAFIIKCIDTQHSPSCFGTLKCHHQGVKHDSAEIGAQCREKQRWMEAVYCNWQRSGYIPSITIMFDSLIMAF